MWCTRTASQVLTVASSGSRVAYAMRLDVTLMAFTALCHGHKHWVACWLLAAQRASTAGCSSRPPHKCCINACHRRPGVPHRTAFHTDFICLHLPPAGAETYHLTLNADRGMSWEAALASREAVTKELTDAGRPLSGAAGFWVDKIVGAAGQGQTGAE